MGREGWLGDRQGGGRGCAGLGRGAGRAGNWQALRAGVNFPARLQQRKKKAESILTKQRQKPPRFASCEMKLL